MRRLGLMSLAVLSLPLLGCETLGLSKSTPAPDAAVDTSPTCPGTAVLAEAASITKLKPGSPVALNPANMVFSAEMSQAQLNCNYDREANKLSIDISFAVRATRGPAAMGAEPALDFFVAVVDVDNNIIVKKLFQNHPDMGGKASNIYRANVGSFPVPLAMDKRPADYEILTGFQLTREELAYNRVPRALPAPRTAGP